LLQGPSVPLKLPPHVHAVTKRPSGRVYYYFAKHRSTDRAAGRVRLPDNPASPEFWAAYAELMQLPAPPPQRTDLVQDLAKAWQASPEWAEMSVRTRQEWARLVKVIVDGWGDLPVANIRPQHVLAFRDQFAATPAKANNLMRVMRSMLAWSVPRGWRPDVPFDGVKLLSGGDGYAPWPWDVIEAAKAELRPDLWWAVALALYSGQRLSDVLAMRWNAINASGLLAVKQGKTGKHLLIPIHRDLQAVLDAIPRKALTILTNAEGRPWGADGNGFQTTWQKHKPTAVQERGLVFHGLRKSAVVTLLEAGCTDAEVAAITGQSRAMVEHYARLVNQEKLARSAILKWEQNAK
jgi:integrase